MNYQPFNKRHEQLYQKYNTVFGKRIVEYAITLSGYLADKKIDDYFEMVENLADEGEFLANKYNNLRSLIG